MTVETANVRCVYQPLYIHLITNKASNILQDIDTLHLFARVVSDLCRSAGEREILTKASRNSATSTTSMTASTSKLPFFSGKHTRPLTPGNHRRCIYIDLNRDSESFARRRYLMSDPIRRPSLSAVTPNANLPPLPNSSPAAFKYSHADLYTVNSLNSFSFGNAHSGGSVSAYPVSLLDDSTDDDSPSTASHHTFGERVRAAALATDNLRAPDNGQPLTQIRCRRLENGTQDDLQPRCLQHRVTSSAGEPRTDQVVHTSI
ncbi:hypothetical protein BDZ89DRAFT_328345 [Hymenopellis radicata]|nr:hypothetical protein BDZ89DRAFT_328345 [Hymenopellis radicata]